MFNERFFFTNHSHFSEYLCLKFLVVDWSQEMFPLLVL